MPTAQELPNSDAGVVVVKVLVPASPLSVTVEPVESLSTTLSSSTPLHSTIKTETITGGVSDEIITGNVSSFVVIHGRVD